MDNKEFGKLFSYLCKENNKNDSFIANAIGVDRATVGRWKKGERSPNLSALPVIANYFNISMDAFTENADDYINSSAISKKKQSCVNAMTHSVPVYGRIPAGTPFEAIEQRLDDVSIPNKLAHKKGLFGLEIVGDSMNKIIPDGAIGVFQKCCEVNPGDVAAIMVNGDDATVKHFYKLNNGCLLEPDSYNNEHKPRIISESEEVDVKIIGKLLWYCMDIDEWR